MSNNTLIQITAQYYEDKRPKGSQIFHLYADDLNFLYGKEQCIQAIQELLDKQSNDVCEYKYVSHELIFHTPIQLNSDEFEAAYDEICSNL